MMPPPVVVKVGGSLYDLPDLAARLHAWLGERFGTSVILVPGGGPTADVIRQLDRRHGLGEEISHWLALRALTLNAHFLAALLPSARVVPDVVESEKSPLAILDVHEFARADEARAGHLPHRWIASSDAFAARAAVVAQARQLVLLKSVTVPAEVDWAEAGRLGWVDETFADVLRDAPGNLQVSGFNLRAWPG
jgi:aspartokinase-like uncharacterized kinase